VATARLHLSLDGRLLCDCRLRPHLAVTDNAFVAACTDGLSERDSAVNLLLLSVSDDVGSAESVRNSDRADFLERTDCCPDDDASCVSL